jgi:abscisic acid receptor (PYR/PYL family)
VLLCHGAGYRRPGLHRLVLEEERHVISFNVVGGNHRLANYRSVTTLHPSPAGNGTVVIECSVVDVPPGNTHAEHLCIS